MARDKALTIATLLFGP